MSDASRIPTEVWAGLLVAVGLTACLLLKDTPKVNSTKINAPVKDLLKELDQKSIPESIEILKRYSIRAQKIIPFFPNFPNVWLGPPVNKGSHASMGERYCAEFMQLLFPGYSFQKVRPSWLINKRHGTGRCLELDAYCPELELAIEYNGPQHYLWPNFTGMTLEQFNRQRERDEYKEEVCIQRNVCLIRIPYTVSLERIPIAIYAKLLEAVPEL